MNYSISFTNPWALLLGPPLLVYFTWLVRHSLADLSPVRRYIALALRIVVCSLIVLALAGIQVVRYNRDLAVMFVVDYSDSVGPAAKLAAQNYINDAVKRARAGDKWGVVVFGREAYVDLAVNKYSKLGTIETAPPSTQFTDIASAVRLAVASMPDGMQKRVVVLSDGNENLGNAIDEAQAARNNDVTIDVVPLSSPQQHEVMLEKLTMPSEAKIGEPLELKVVARSMQETSATIKLFRDGKYLGNRGVTLQRGKNIFVFPQSVAEAGPATFEARIEASKSADTEAENNRALGLVNVQGKPRILLVGSDPEQSRFLLNALRGEKVETEIRGPGGLPEQLRGMSAFDAIVLDNIPAWDLSAQQLMGLQAYVRDLGCGLVMVGGEYSYGPGGYRATPVEEALPVTMDIKNMQYIPGGAVAMIMHSCEFTNGNDWAKAVCSQVTRQLGDNDYAGLCIFGYDANWVYPMLKVGPNRNKMLTMIRGINPGDMPDFDAALEKCYSGLITTKAYLKHCIILSDGDPSPPAPSLVAKFNKARITVSTVVIQPHDQSGAVSMQNIARIHGGRFYSVTNPNQIPNIFLKEAATVSRSAIIEEPFYPTQNMDSSIMKGIDRMPALGGYVGTSLKAKANDILVSNDKDPVLATWQYGLGKSVAFTSDARQRWAAGWLGWPGFSKFWAQSVRWSMRQSSASDLQTQVDIDKGRGKITIEAVDEKGNFLNFLNPKARLVPPDMSGTDLTLDQTGPGHYEATFDARQLGTYLVNIRTQRGDKTVSQVTGGVLPYSPEYSAVGSDDYFMSRLSETGGGELVKTAEAGKTFGRTRSAARSPKDIWLNLLILAACLFPLDVAVRRLMWGEAEAGELWQRLRQRGKRGPRAKKPPRDAGMDRLLRSKERAVTTVTATEAPRSAPPPPGGASPPPGGAPPPPPGSGRYVPPQPGTAPVEEEEEIAPVEDAELDPMERLRRAKRRARGED